MSANISEAENQITSILDAAIAGAKRGWLIFPAPRGVKKSELSKKYSGNNSNWGATTDPDRLKQYWGKWPGSNIGVVTGAASGIFVIETDTKAGGHKADGEIALRELEAKYGPLPKTRMAISSSGSKHYYFKHPGYKVSNSASEIGPGIDVRGDGGMVIAPPSRTKTGQYGWLDEGDIAEAPEWLLQLVKAKPSPEPNFGNDDHQPDPEDDPEVIFLLLTFINPDIPRKGWFDIACYLYRVLGSVNGFIVWNGWSKDGSKYFEGRKEHQCQDQWQSIVNNKGYGHYTIGTLIFWANESGRDWQTSFDKYQEARLGLTSSSNKPNAPAPAPARPGIIPVDLWAKFDPPPLPTGLLPQIIERFAFEQGELMGADPAGLAMAALTVCAAATPDHVTLQPKKHDYDWVEAMRIWTALIGLPSVLKSPIISRVSKPVFQIDARMWGEYSAAKQHYDELSKEERRNATRPVQTRLRLEDTTMEGAQEILKDSPNGVLLLRDELGGWFGSMDKYAGSRGAGADRGFWLQAYNGGPYAFTRIGRGSALIPNLSVSVLGGIQPDAIRAITADTVGDGLLQRLIPVVLRPAILTKDEPISADTNDLYIGTIDRLQQMGPNLLKFDRAAMAIRQNLEQKHLDLGNCESINKKLAAHIGKYNGLFVRLCLLWHCIENGEGLVKERTAQRVADFLDQFLLPHAISFYVDVLGLSDDHDRLAAVAGYILARKLTKITNSDIHHGDRTMRNLKQHETREVFHQLEALGWINQAPGYRLSGPPQWLVNPEVHRRFADRGAKEAERRKRERQMILALVKPDKRGREGGPRSDP
jgi:hypothetical protein